MKEAVYQGHGQIEAYPLNSALFGIISHEQRHANFNRYIANLKNEKVKQDIKVTIQYKDGYPVPVKAYTEARFSKKSRIRKEEDFIKILYLNLKISKIKKKLKKTEKDFIDLKKYEEELRKIKKDIFGGHNIKNLFNFKRDNATFYGIFDFQKYNLPPVLTTNPLISGYRIEQKLTEINKDDNISGSTTSKIIEAKDFYRDSLTSQWEELYSKINKFNSFLKNFKINFSKIESTDIEASVDEQNIEEKDITVKINQVAKPLIIFSKKIYEPYESLHLSGTIKINGISVSIESDDSLYDITQKINWGEDANHNGVLDYDEGEDTNNNEQLDGGTVAHGVYAYIEDNRLYLKNIDEGDKSIVFTDSNNILHDLKLIAENPYNNSTYFPNVLQHGQNAVVYINGEKIISETNTIIYDNILLYLKNKTDKEESIKILIDNDKIYTDIENFVSEYNKIIKSLNEKLSNEKFTESLIALLLKRNFKIAILSDIDESQDITNIGLNIKDSKDYLTELQISNISNKKFKNSLHESLSSIGLKENDDETIIIDENKLKSSIKNNLGDIKKIFFSDNGIVHRLQNFLNKVLDETNGMIKNQISEISSDELNEIKKFFLKEKVLTYFYEEKLSTLNKIIT